MMTELTVEGMMMKWRANSKGSSYLCTSSPPRVGSGADIDP